LATRRADGVVAEVGCGGSDFVDWGACFVEGYTEDVGEVGEEEGYQWGRDVERGGEDDANISDSHLIEPGIVDDLNQE
jgi:hypothetical protein